MLKEIKMGFGNKTLQRNNSGSDVVELQLRLSGFRGTIWDGYYGPGTELQVITFQRDYMGMQNPTGIADANVFHALKKLAETYPIDFNTLKCDCGDCNGFGKGRFKGQYRGNISGVEQRHMYEYPGIHKAILHAFRAAAFYCEQAGLGRAFITSGYRCWVDNNKRGRVSTNHMGKALDLDFPMRPGDDKETDKNRCNLARAIMVDKCHFQIAWNGNNQKALEPADIAPTWVHMDVRQYSPRFLDDIFFVTDSAQLDSFDMSDEANNSVINTPVPTTVDPARHVSAILQSLNLP
jgi:hypothetical protein